MTLTEALLDPTGMDVNASEGTLAPRPTTLRGLRVGLLDNTKANGTLLLEAIAEQLRAQQGIGETRLYTKDYFGTPAKQSLLEQIAKENDVVISAIGDCGSCSAATVADGILLEKAGVPTVSIISDAFAPSGEAMAQVQGFPGFEFAVAAHPIASLTGDEINDRARTVTPTVLRILGVEA